LADSFNPFTFLDAIEAEIRRAVQPYGP
jgi:hypothetical protein